jgi:hypothetical protein
MGDLGMGYTISRQNSPRNVIGKRDRCWSGDGDAAFQAGQGSVDGLPAAGEAPEQLDLG